MNMNHELLELTGGLYIFVFFFGGGGLYKLVDSR